MNYTGNSILDPCIGLLSTIGSFPRLAILCFGLGATVTAINPGDPCDGVIGRSDAFGLVCAVERTPTTLADTN